MARSAYYPVVREIDGKSTLDVELTLKQPLNSLLEYIDSLKDSDIINKSDIESNIFTKLEQRDKDELSDIYLDKNFRFTDDLKILDKDQYSKDDLKDIYYELVRRRYLDLKYDTDYIHNTLLGKFYENGSDIYFGTSVLAIDLVTFYRLYFNFKKYNKGSESSLKMTYDEYLQDNNIYYKVPFIVDDPNSVETMMKILLNKDNKIGLNVRDRIRDLKYHKATIYIEKPTFSKKLIDSLKMKEDMAGLKEGSNFSRDYFNKLATELYKHVLSKGYLISFKYDMHGVLGALLTETIWEILLIQMCENPDETINTKFNEGDMVLFSTYPALSTMTKVLNKPDQTSYGYKDIFIDDSLEGKPILDYNAVTIGRIAKINNLKRELTINKSLIIQRRREFIQDIKESYNTYFSKEYRKAFVEYLERSKDVTKKDNYSNLLPTSVTNKVKVLIPGYYINEFQHYPNKELNTFITQEEFINNFVPVAWTVGNVDNSINPKSYYHRNSLKESLLD